MQNKWFRRLLAALSIVSISAFAQDASLKERRELAVKLIQTSQQGMDPKKFASAMVEPMKLAMINSIKTTNPNLTEAYYSKYSDVVSREASTFLDGVIAEIFPSMMQSMADLYADKFTASELNELITIHENPLFKRGTTIAIEGMPKLMMPYMQSIQQRAQVLGPRMNQALAREGLLPPPKQ